VCLDAVTVMSWKSLLTALFLLLLTSCVIPIPIPVSASPARAAAELEPPAKYDHPYDGEVEERVVSEAEVRTVCTSMGTDHLVAACSWQNDGTCYIVIPNDGQAPVDTYRRHEIAHCNGWPADHPHDG
jgi:hypothetical protein